MFSGLRPAKWFSALLSRFVEPVTLRRVDPDTGATLSESTGCDAVRTNADGSPFAVAPGGSVPVEVVTWYVRADMVAWVPAQRDRVIDAAGVVWVAGPQVTGAIEYGMYVLKDCVRLRG